MRGAERRAGTGVPELAVSSKPRDLYLELPKIEGLDEGPGVVLLVGSQSLGEPDGEAGRRLMGLFLSCLLEMPSVVKAVVLVNDGVHLACEGSSILHTLDTLKGQGTQVICCSNTCNHLDVEPLVGYRASMLHIAEMLLGAAKVISL
ncbi:MAG: hypothetical protein HPY55_04935 [Firmicutes bacterium]|nr:hypothetical protein [Bacillota bacterium]